MSLACLALSWSLLWASVADGGLRLTLVAALASLSSLFLASPSSLRDRLSCLHECSLLAGLVASLLLVE